MSDNRYYVNQSKLDLPIARRNPQPDLFDQLQVRAFYAVPSRDKRRQSLIQRC